MPLPACAMLLGLLCLTGDPGKPKIQHLLYYHREDVPMRGYTVSLATSHVQETYDRKYLQRKCFMERCFLFRVEYRDCGVTLLLFGDKGEAEVETLSVSYEITAKKQADLRRALTEVYVRDDGLALVNLEALVEIERVAPYCPR